MTVGIKNLVFGIFYPFFKLRYKSLQKEFPSVMNTISTLNMILKDNVSISRYGDGEFNIMSGYDIGFQESSNDLFTNLKRVIDNPIPNCLIGIPDVFNGMSRFTTETRFFWIYTIVSKWKIWKKIIPTYKYADSLCSRFYMDLKYKDNSEQIVSLWKKIWDNRDVVIVEGEYTKMGIGNDLFGNSKSLARVICPSKNAFEMYPEILQYLQTLDKNNLFLIALGPTATVLAYDMAKAGYQALDTGHLDVEYNWMKKKATRKVAIEGRMVNEVASNGCIEKCNDREYEDQIVKIFKSLDSIRELSVNH